jgi:hypothetical protein
MNISTKNWRDRAAVTLSNGVAEATVLPGGGHLARWGMSADRGTARENLLWEVPWKTADPGTEEYAAIAKELGAEEGQYLAAYTGHPLCLDGFGAASAADLAAGVSLHGEAPSVMWEFTTQAPDAVTGSTVLPVAELRVERRFSLLDEEAVLRVEESVTNLRDKKRPLHWVQHATFGSLGMSASDVRMSASVEKGITFPLDYDGRGLLKLDAEFIWPYAPGADGETVDLRRLFTRPGKGFVASTRQREGREHGFVAGCGAGRVVGYLFRVEDFPWMAIWEENLAREVAPWSGRVQARGMEFGTTPQPLGNEVVDARGPLFGKPTSRMIEAKETLRAPWMLFAADVPRDWEEVEDVHVEADAIVLWYKGQQVRVKAQGVAAFLGKGR